MSLSRTSVCECEGNQVSHTVPLSLFVLARTQVTLVAVIVVGPPGYDVCAIMAQHQLLGRQMWALVREGVRLC